jgi:nitrogen-specific signal transduction histidine kinase
LELLNHLYSDKRKLTNFINRHPKLHKENILLQIFTAQNDKEFIENLIQTIKKALPSIKIIGSTTSGEIYTKNVYDNTTVLSFSLFDKTKVHTYIEENKNNSFDLGKTLISNIKNDDTKVAICFGDGLFTNGEEFLNGISSKNEDIIISGGLASDYSKFENTFVFTENGITNNGAVLASLENKDLIVETKYNFNWDTLGLKHKITKSNKNRVYTIGDKTAVEFYKYYLGDKIESLLPSIGIEFPLIIVDEKNFNIARAVIKKHEDGSLSFAGNIKENSSIQLGFGNINKIIQESERSINEFENKKVEAIFIYSCMARHTLLQENSKIEIAPYQRIAKVSGFFTNGEFYRDCKGNDCKNYLLNETMTILALSENKSYEKNSFDTKILINEHDQLEINRQEALSQFITRISSEMEYLNQNLQKRVDEKIKINKEQERLLQISNTHAEMGSMMEMILHQWRQPLNGILTATSGIQVSSELDILTKEELLKITNTIMDLTNYANETIEDFRSLFKNEEHNKQISPRDVVKKAKQVLKSILSKNNIKFNENYMCKEKKYLNIPAGQFLQVIIIILKNAIDAIMENAVAKPNISISVMASQGECIFFIEDNGGGIPQEIIDKIFNKRFSTKSKSHGTGIGLDICKTVVEKTLKGKITATNGKDGAIFCIRLPHI